MQSSFFSMRTLVLGVAAVAATSVAIAQEVQGQKGAAAAGVPKAVNVTQAQLNSAGGQTARRNRPRPYRGSCFPGRKPYPIAASTRPPTSVAMT